MATALLISGQVKAAVNVSTAEQLQQAIDNAAAGSTTDIVLSGNIEVTKPIQVAANYASQLKTINLNLNGKQLSNNTDYAVSVIELYKGKLNISNGKIDCSFETTYKQSVFGGDSIKDGVKVIDQECKDGIIVHGVYQDKEEWAVLTIGKDVEVTADKNAITVLEFYGPNVAYFSGVADANELVKYYTLGSEGQVEMFNNGVWNGPTLNLAQANQIGAYYFYAYTDQTVRPRVNPGMDSLLSHSTDTVAANKYVKKATKTTAANIWGWQKVATKEQTDLVKYPWGINNITFAADKKTSGAARPNVVDYTGSVPCYVHQGEWFQSGMVRTSHKESGVTIYDDTTAYTYYKNCYKAVQYAKANGIKINIDGYVYGGKYGIKVNGTLSHKSTYQPQVVISETGSVNCSSSTDEAFQGKESTAVYCSGQATWLIKGTVTGNIGVVVKAGDVTIDDATITATGTAYEEITGGGSGINGGAGTGILVDSHNGAGYSDEGISVKITGDTKVSGGSGYAINEVIVGDDSYVSNVTIEGGSFTEGGQGAIAMTETTVDDGVVEVNGAIVSGETFIGGTSGKLDDLRGEGTFVSQVTVGGETVLIVSKGEKPGDTPVSINSDIEEGKSVILAAETVTMDGNKTLGYVQMTNATVITIDNNDTLRVDKLVMGDDAQIIINPGSALLVMGDQGLIADTTSNLVIKANASGMGTFAYNPDASSNRTPMATVEYYTTARKRENGNKFDIFCFPFIKGTVTEITKDSANVGTNYQHVVNGKWVKFANQDEFMAEAEPFEAIAFTNNQKYKCVTYTFKGQLQGNISGELKLNKGFNYIGNPYFAKMVASEIIKGAPAKVDKYISMWNGTGYNSYNKQFVEKAPQLNPMNMFVIWADEAVTAKFNYEKLIWNNLVK